MDAADLAFAGIARQAELIRLGEVSSRELVQTYLDRIGRLDARLNAFRVVLGEQALAGADAADARVKQKEDAPLLGVPVAIKDDTDVAGEVTAFGTAAYGAPAPEDAEVVRRLRAAGAIVLGKTNVPELTQWPFTESATWGATRNPWDVDRTPGGSSGGSAAAVAAGLVGAALGSDGGGSVRIPAACCGLFGLKTQRGRISCLPFSERWHGLLVYGPLTRSVMDAALFTDAVAGNAEGDAVSAPPPSRPFADAAVDLPGKLRIALSFKVPPGIVTTLDDDVRRAVEETAELLRSLGHEVTEKDPDYGAVVPNVVVRYLRGIHDDAVAMARPERLERRTRGMSRMGGLIPEAVLARARAGEQQLTGRMNRLFDDHDVLLTPTLAWPPVEVGRWEGRGAQWCFNAMIRFVPFTPPWNASGQPAAAVPAGFTLDGLPLSAQLVGRPNDESTLISLAAQIEAERPWAERRPPVS